MIKISWKGKSERMKVTRHSLPWSILQSGCCIVSRKRERAFTTEDVIRYPTFNSQPDSFHEEEHNEEQQHSADKNRNHLHIKPSL